LVVWNPLEHSDFWGQWGSTHEHLFLLLLGGDVLVLAVDSVAPVASWT
jgi:hypothetical protein